MDIRKYINAKNDIETIIGIIIGVVFGEKFITIMAPYFIKYASSGITISTGTYAPLIAIITGVILFFGIRTLAYLISSMFLGTGISIAIFELAGINIYSSLAGVFNILLILH